MRIWSRLVALARGIAQPAGKDQEVGSDNPETALARQREMLRHVRRELVTLTADRNRLEIQIERLRRRSIRAGERARQAVSAGQDEPARFQLLRKRAAEQQLASLESQRARLVEGELRLARKERILAQQIDAYRKRYRDLVVRGASSGALVRLGAMRLPRRMGGATGNAEAVERDRRSA